MAELLDRSPPGLVDALCKRVSKILGSSWWHDGEFSDEEYHTPVVHAQYLPVSKTKETERDFSKDYPFVQVVCTTGSLANFRESVINIQFYFGGYLNSTDNQGWRIPISMLWAVLQSLLEGRLVEGYLLDVPINWNALNSKEPPYYFAQLDTTWRGDPPSVSVLEDEESLNKG